MWNEGMGWDRMKLERMETEVREWYEAMKE
jgi:hypothetical protein